MSQTLPQLTLKFVKQQFYISPLLTHNDTHTQTPLCGYGLNNRSTEGLSSWWIRDFRSPFEKANPDPRRRGCAARIFGAIEPPPFASLFI